MNKELFLNDLRRFLSDIPEEEREQAIAYYEDYFEDAGPENEQRIIQELGSPVDIAKQIKMVNHDSIEYGQGNTFSKAQAYPQSTGNFNQNTGYNAGANGFNQNSGYNAGANGYNQNNGYNTGSNGYNQNNGYNTGAHGYNQNAYKNAAGGYNQTTAKKSWTESPSKIVLVVILALLAVPVGIPLVSAIFGIIIAILSVIFSIVVALFALGGSLFIGGVVTIFGSIFMTAAGGFASALFTMGVGLILASIGAFILWFGILFCAKFIPVFFKSIGKCCSSIGTKFKKFFQ